MGGLISRYAVLVVERAKVRGGRGGVGCAASGELGGEMTMSAAAAAQFVFAECGGFVFEILFEIDSIILTFDGSLCRLLVRRFTF